MKKTLVILTFCLVLLASFAQQDAQFSMNMFNRLAINPAYAGMNKTLCVTTLGRQQWVSFPGAPKTGLVSIDYGRILGGGIGLTVDQDQAGFQKMLNIKLAYSYHIKLNVGTIGLGLNAGMFQSSLNAGKDGFVSSDGGSNSTSGVGSTGFDNKIPWGGSKATTYDVGLGVYYQTRRLYAGLSSSHLPEQKISTTGNTAGSVSTANWNYKYQAARHYYITAGYTFILNREWDLTPSVFVKSVVAASQVDANLIAKWRKTLFVGTGYRLKDAIIVMAGVEHKFSKQLNARLGYAYDISSSGLKSNGSHEFMLGFCYKIIPDGGTTSHMNVRFL